jgi:hypothetical protein
MNRLAIRMDYQTALLLPAEAITLLPQAQIVTTAGYNSWDHLHQGSDTKLDFRLVDDSQVGPPPKTDAEKQAERDALRAKADALIAMADAIV